MKIATIDTLAIARAYLREATAKENNEGINSAGGVLVPTSFEDAVIVRRNRAGVFRRNSRQIAMARDAQTTPRRTSDVVAAFVAEGAPLPESEFGFDSISLVARKMGALHRRGSELEEDSIDAEAADLIEGLGHAFSLGEDKAAFNGDGTSAYFNMRGIVPLLQDGKHSASLFTATGHSTFSAITAGDIAETIGLLPDWATQTAKFYVSAYGFASCFARLGATSGLNIGPDGNAERALMFAGFPVELTSQLPGNATLTGKAAILFGDLSLSSTIGTRRGVTIRRLRERFADSDQIGFAATQRIDIVHHDVGDDTTAGGVVALVGG